MSRFVIKTARDLDEYHLEQYDWLDEWTDVLLDTKTNEVVFFDGGEPEDMILCRDLNVFVKLLNELASKLEKVETSF